MEGSLSLLQLAGLDQCLCHERLGHIHRSLPIAHSCGIEAVLFHILPFGDGILHSLGPSEAFSPRRTFSQPYTEEIIQVSKMYDSEELDGKGLKKRCSRHESDRYVISRVKVVSKKEGPARVAGSIHKSAAHSCSGTIALVISIVSGTVPVELNSSHFLPSSIPFALK